MKKLLFLLLALTVSAPAYAQTQTQYYTVPTIAALKAMTTSRPAVVQVVDSNPGIFNLSAGACSAADDIFQVQPTGGTTVCYTRTSTPYAVGKASTFNSTLMFTQTGVPKVAKSPLVDVRSLDNPMVCDGATVNTTAFTAALALGVPLTSRDDVCVVSGSFNLPDGTWLQNIKFKQAAPTGSAGEQRTLYASGANGPFTFIDVVVNRNGSPSDATVPGSAAGIYLAGSAGPTLAGLYMENVEVYGDGPGKGVYVDFALNPVLINPYVHDIRWSKAADPLTEQVFGIGIQRSTNAYVLNPRVANLTGQIAAGSYLPYQTDGLDIGGTTGATVIGGNISNVGEGTDTAGSNLSTNVWFYGTNYTNIGSWAFKYGSIQQSGAVGLRIKDAGLGCIATGANSTTPAGYQAKDLMFNDIQCLDTGSSGVWPNRYGFDLSWDNTNTAPSNIQCNNCSVIDTVGNMTYGFRIDGLGLLGSALKLNNSYVVGGTSGKYSPEVTAGVMTWDTDNTLQVFGGVKSFSSLTTSTRGGILDGTGVTGRYNDNGLSTPFTMQNFGITGINQGASLDAYLGQSSPGVKAGRAYWFTAADFSNAGNQSAEFKVDTISAGSLSGAFRATQTAASVPGTFTAASFIGSGATLTSIPLSGLATQATNTIVGNATSGSAAPTALAVASCSTTTSALIWTTNTGFGCNTFGTAALVATGTSGATIPLLNGANTWSAAQAHSASETWGTGRILTESVSGGNYAGRTVRWDDNSLTTTSTSQNYGITGVNQGISSAYTFGVGGVSGANAGAIEFMSTADWSSGANQSSQFRVRATSAGSTTLVLTATPTTFTVPGTSVATTFSGSGASLTSIPLTGMATQAANTIVGNATAGSASPTALTMTSCSTSTSAVTWTTSTGFGCNTLGTAALVATGTSGATIPLLNAANTWSAIQAHSTGETWGASARLRTFTVTGGNYASDIVRFDDNSLTNTDVRQNYGVTASGQGLGILFQYGAGGSAGNTAGTISFPSTDTWAAGANRSSQFKIETITANTVATVLTGTAAGIAVTGVVKTGGYTVAALPAAPGTGARAYVTDQLTTCAVTGAALTGGGAVTCPVFYNGTAWVGG